MANGNGIVVKTVAGGALGIILTAMGFMGNGIVENDRRNTDQHLNIMKEAVSAHEKIEEKFDTIKTEMHQFSLEQTKQSVILEKIEKKL